MKHSSPRRLPPPKQDRITYTEHLTPPAAVQNNQIRVPMDLDRYLDSVGRLHLLHHDGVPSDVVENQITQQQWSAGIATVADFAQLVIIDGGNSHHFPASRAMLEHLDHLVVCMRMDLTVYNKTAKMMHELRGEHPDLIGAATLVVSQTDPKQGMTPLLARGIESLRQVVGDVFVIPYDHAAGSVGQIKFASLKPATQLAYLDAVTHTAAVFDRDSRHPAVPTSMPTLWPPAGHTSRRPAPPTDAESAS